MRSLQKPLTCLLAFLAVISATATAATAANRLRVMIETDAGGDPDDEQSLVRFLLYCNEWDLEGIIATRPEARPGENLNLERTGLGIVRAQLRAYAECYPKLVRHDPRFPSPEFLRQRTVAGYDAAQSGVQLVIEAVDNSDSRPLWFCNWGTDRGSAESSLKRALDRVLRERGPKGYARFKERLRLSSDDQFGEHTTSIPPRFPLWIDTFRPAQAGKRWYHRFSALTATAGGFDIEHDVRSGHGPLGRLYPLNTTHSQKEGDTMTFLYLVPTGMNDVEQPALGSWAGRYGPREEFPHSNYYWANQADSWNGTTNRDNTLRRWAAHLQNDFKARMDWCVQDFAHANHPPTPQISGPRERSVNSGEEVLLDARGSTDPDDGQSLVFEWLNYPEAADWPGPAVIIRRTASPTATFIAPAVDTPRTLHIVLVVTDTGAPPLTRYRRLLVRVLPSAATRP